MDGAPRALAVAAHPDDIEFMMAGTLLRLADAGWEAFIAECQRMGCDEITEIYQQVFDRWNAALQ